MTHYRIKEVIEGDNIVFFIQYTAWFLFIIRYWRTKKDITYKKYHDALVECKRLINNERDYTVRKNNKVIKYHYIDAFRLNKKNLNPSIRKMKDKNGKDKTPRTNKSTFVKKDYNS